jgi:hypothetical protein
MFTRDKVILVHTPPLRLCMTLGDRLGLGVQETCRRARERHQGHAGERQQDRHEKGIRRGSAEASDRSGKEGCTLRRGNRSPASNRSPDFKHYPF